MFYYILDTGLETRDTKMYKIHSPPLRTHTPEKTNSHTNKQFIWQSEKRVDSECLQAMGNPGSGNKFGLGNTKKTFSKMLFDHDLEKKEFVMCVSCDGLHVEGTAVP